MPYSVEPRFTNGRVPPLSIIVPALDEAAIIARALEALAPLRQGGAEVIVVDGGSQDGTAELARPRAARVIPAGRGRSAQMNAGASLARGEVLLFLHGDTSLPPDADRLVLRALVGANAWGRFDVHIEGRSPLLALVATLMNWRSRLTGIATGDQAMFASRKIFAEAGGFPEIPLMEDIALSRTLKRIARPICLAARVTTSGRRWQRFPIKLARQPGGDLGARMHAALDAACPAIVIGTDCPTLEPKHLRGSADALRDGADAVVIPAEDGGYVLIGLRQPRPGLFADMPWGTATVMAETPRRAAQLVLAVRELAPPWDLDVADDLERLREAGLAELVPGFTSP